VFLIFRGIAKRLRARDSGARYSRALSGPHPSRFGADSYRSRNARFGTVAQFMSPEQCRRRKTKLDSRSDIYSIVVILYEMLTGQLPFTARRRLNVVPCTSRKREADQCDHSLMFRGPLERSVMRRWRGDTPRRRHATAD
jgi:serine/threonine protein kinase